MGSTSTCSTWLHRRTFSPSTWAPYTPGTTASSTTSLTSEVDRLRRARRAAPSARKRPTPAATRYNRSIVPARPLVRSPNISGTVGYQHTQDLPNGAEVILGVRSQFSTGYYTAIDYIAGLEYQGGFTNTSADLTYQAPGGHWSVTAYVKNLENDGVVSGGSEQPLAAGVFYGALPTAPHLWRAGELPLLSGAMSVPSLTPTRAARRRGPQPPPVAPSPNPGRRGRSMSTTICCRRPISPRTGPR